MDRPIDLAVLQRLGQGRAAEVFALDDERVIKVMRSTGGTALAREAVALRAAWAAGVPVPAPHDLVEVAGRPALIMGRVHGVDMLTLFASRPWSILGAGTKLGKAHARMHDVIAPPELPSVKELVGARITS